MRDFAVVAAALLSAGCSDAKPASPTHSEAAPARDPSAWQCYVADSHNAYNPAGNVTHLKQRMLPDRWETENVHVHDGVVGKGRDVVPRVGDHFEKREDGATSTITLQAADGTHSTYHFRDDTGYEWFDEQIVDARGMTSVATDPGPDGKPVKTTIHFVPAPCYVVDAELAKY